jgi:hypothetical protein
MTAPAEIRRVPAEIRHLHLAAAWSPCSTPVERERPMHATWYRRRTILVRAVVTLDVARAGAGAGGDFVPGDFGRAAWHSSVMMRDVDASGAGARYGTYPWIPVQSWSRDELLTLWRIACAVLDGVGLGDPGYPLGYVPAGDVLHSWKAPRPGDLHQVDHAVAVGR